jgi:hypothetical protein
MAVPINIGTKAKPVGLTCWSANPAAQQRRPTTRCADVVVICYTFDPKTKASHKHAMFRAIHAEKSKSESGQLLSLLAFSGHTPFILVRFEP